MNLMGCMEILQPLGLFGTLALWKLCWPKKTLLAFWWLIGSHRRSAISSKWMTLRRVTLASSQHREIIDLVSLLFRELNRREQV